MVLVLTCIVSIHFFLIFYVGANCRSKIPECKALS
jgi:hypothetical protein